MLCGSPQKLCKQRYNHYRLAAASLCYSIACQRARTVYGFASAYSATSYRSLSSATFQNRSPYLQAQSLRRQQNILQQQQQQHNQQQIRMVQGVAIDDDGCIVNINPATGEVLEKVKCTTSNELTGILQAAKAAQPAWAETPVADRISALRQGLQALTLDGTRLGQLITREMGKPLAESQEEVLFATGKDEYFDVMELALQPRRHPNCLIVRQPYGVAAILSPWNFPVDEILLLVLPALASGNVAIVKPSEVTPLCGQAVVQALALALPLNVIQVVQGDGRVGSQLVSSPDVDIVAMTGSSATGQKILQAATQGERIKRVVLEMGGKDPMMVMPSADIGKAARDAVHYSLSNSGQVCCSIERVYVAEAIYDEFCNKVAKIAAEYKVGNGLDGPDIKVGPLVSERQRDLVKDHVDDATTKGATVLYQSEIPADAPPGSSFYPVTVLSDVNESMKMYYEETFGPVVSIIKFDGTEISAVRLANDTVYGLGSCVYSTDMMESYRIADSIHAGQVGINCYALENMHVRCPWVGHKQSGFGFHSGDEGVLQFTIPKTLVFPNMTCNSCQN